jgi:hypothetical protein
MQSKTKYGIYPPKYAGNSVYYKDIIVFELKDNAVTRAWIYDYNMNRELYYGAISKSNVSTYFENIKDSSELSAGVMVNSSSRSIWLFDTPEAAAIQKIIALKIIRDYVISKEKEQRRYFNSKIPPEVYNANKNIKIKYPEYFL